MAGSAAGLFAITRARAADSAASPPQVALGTTGITGLIYAPNATVTNGGNVDWYGAIIGGKVKDFGTAAIHYDRQLDKKMMMVGAYMLDSFTWRKF